MILDLDRIMAVGSFGTEGSGNQVKNWSNIDGKDYLIKLNSNSREASKEVSVSKFLAKAGIEHVDYIEQQFKYGGRDRKGCICKTYLNKNEASIPLYQVIRDLQITKNESTLDYFNKTVAKVREETGLPEQYIVDYLITVMVIDYIVMNPDRHLNNIELVICNNRVTRFSPLFDFGQSFLNRDGMMAKSQFMGIEQKFKSLPFSRNPEKNLIDINYAKGICKRVLANVGDINKLNIPEFHRYVIKYRIDRLLSIQ